MTATKTYRYGHVTHKVMLHGPKPKYIEMLVRDEGDGMPEYCHFQTGKWHLVPADLIDSIRWDA